MFLHKVAKWIEENKFEFLEGGTKTCEEIKKILTPAETQSKLLQLMNSDENCDCISGWIMVSALIVVPNPNILSCYVVFNQFQLLNLSNVS